MNKGNGVGIIKTKGFGKRAKSRSLETRYWVVGAGVFEQDLMKVKVLVTQSCPTLVIPWTVAHQAPLSMGFSRREYWGGLPFPSPGDLPKPRIEHSSPTVQADALPTEPPGKP